MKKVLVLGASSDVGMAYIKHLDSTYKPHEAQIIAHYRTMSHKLEELISSTRNIQVDAVYADLSLAADVGRLIGQIREKYIAPTHILHLAASPFMHMRLKQLDSDAVKREIDIQVISLGEIFKEFLPVMAKNHYGKVVVMLSAYTIGVPPKFVAGYAVCKYALLGLMKAAAAEYCDKGLCINGLSPSMIETKFLDNIDGKIVEMAAAESPAKRNVSIAEVVSAIDFLMADENSYICGINLNLTGGALL